MAGALRRDERDVDAGRRLDLAVVDREAVPEEQQVAVGDPVADLLLPDRVMELVGDEHHHDVAPARGLDDARDLEPGVARRGNRARGRPQPDDDLDARVLEVQRMGVALGAVADDGDGLAVEQLEVRVVVVDHGRQAICWMWAAHAPPTGSAHAPTRRWVHAPTGTTQASATATCVRPGTASSPLASV